MCLHFEDNNQALYYIPGMNFLLFCSEIVFVYFILSSEINVYLKQIKMVFSHSETI